MVLVFGSINVDLVMHVARHPAPGETLLADGFAVFPGGKGANQAVAAARAGGQVHMYGAVGTDAYGAEMRSNLARNGVHAHGIETVDDAATGCATITVDRKGQNAICVAPGANAKARASNVPHDALRPDTIVVMQMEVDAAENRALLRRAKERGARTLLNFAPAADCATAMLSAIRDWVDFLVVNETEAGELLRALGAKPAAPDADARALCAALDATIVLTLGPRGVCAADANCVHRAAALPVQVIDTTGAGDCFVGVFAAMLDRGEHLPRALSLAAVAGSIACTRRGAQAAMPDGQTILERALRDR